MPHPTHTRRFRNQARTITIAALSAAGVVMIIGALAIALSGSPRDGVVVAYGIAMAAILLLVGACTIITQRLARTLRVLRERHPGDVVFLARRLPPIVSNLADYLRNKGVETPVGDGWLGAVADSRGVTIYSHGADPHALVLIEWAEIGDIAMVRTPTVGGDSRWSVTVDIRPYDVPLTADLGEAWGIVTMALGAADTSAAIDAVTARRPARFG